MISRALFHCCLFHDYKWTVDKRGLHVKSIRFNNLSERIHNKKEVCLTNYEYDEYGNLIELRFYGVDEQLKEDENGIAIYRNKYDEYGNKTETKQYDKADKSPFILVNFAAPWSPPLFQRWQTVKSKM